MTVIKSWSKEAHGIGYGQVGLSFNETTQTLVWSREYHFLDESGNRLELGVLEDGSQYYEVGEMVWDDIPKSIQDALILIDQYTKDQINLKEGME